MKLTLDAVTDHSQQVEITDDDKTNSFIFSSPEDFADDSDKNHKIVDIMQRAFREIKAVLNEGK